jgi:YidC/Oxa1 family membrane protein insertase
MDQKRTLTFLILAFLIILGSQSVIRFFQPPRPPAKPAAQVPKAEGDKGAKPAEVAAAKEGEPKAKPAEEKPVAPAIAPLEKLEQEWVTLGSADPNDPYRMLVTFTNQGAAVERIELNSPRYHDVEDQQDHSGYLGHLQLANAPDKGGALVRVVGRGTPAAVAGLKPGDVITEFNGKKITAAIDMRAALRETTADEKCELKIAGKDTALSVTLGYRPLAVVKPEHHGLETDPLSFLLTLEQIDNRKIEDGKSELDGVDMLTANWKRLAADPNKPDEVAFEYRLPNEGLVIVKRFTLAKVPADQQKNPDDPAYHLNLKIEITNQSGETRQIAYRLDGPTGLPLEGSWYAYKINRETFMGGGAGLRDVVVGQLDGQRIDSHMTGCVSIVDNPKVLTWKDQPLAYVGVDAHYFSSALLPDATTRGDISEAQPIRVGPVPKEGSEKNQTDVSCRVISKPVTLKPAGDAQATATDAYQIFAGPKSPSLLAGYRLEGLVYYGTFGFIAAPMLSILHFFYGIVGNYGIAIIMLTVLVRLCMFPLSRKQAANAAKMQELQPEIKKITEKYKTNMEARAKAQQELFKKHNYHPLSGCLPVFVQLPIFMGLYRSLAVDVELRQAPLISESVRWCSNLGAPDMFWYWRPYLPAFLGSEHGFLGPYLNLLPLVTIALFLWQQKIMMPPPTDEQSAMQQKIMQYMMIFMALMFFKVPAGLCIYFIASSLWSIAERKLLPKTQPPKGDEPITVRSRPVSGPGSNGNGAKAGKSKQTGKK